MHIILEPSYECWSADRPGVLRSPAEFCVGAPVRVGDVDVHVLGIHHHSLASAEDVTKAWTQLSPALLCLESDVERTTVRREVQLPFVDGHGGLSQVPESARAVAIQVRRQQFAAVQL